jgi:hypothetical protein
MGINLQSNLTSSRPPYLIRSHTGRGTCFYLCPRRRRLSKNGFTALAGTIFLIVAVAHALRLIFKWQVIVAGWYVPMWLSAVVIVIAAYLAYEGFRKSKSS